MSEELDPRIADLKAWLLMPGVRDPAFYLQDRICRQFGLNIEQYQVLAAIKYHDPPVRVGDIASWMGHCANTGSMIVDRMVRAGLLERFRDLPDRREVRVTITKRGEQAFKQATRPLWAFVQTIMSALSPDEKSTLIDLLEKVRTAEHQHFPPDATFRIARSYDTSDPPPPSSSNAPASTPILSASPLNHGLNHCHAKESPAW